MFRGKAGNLAGYQEEVSEVAIFFIEGRNGGGRRGEVLHSGEG